MELIAVLLIAVGLAMDAFAVSLCKGFAMKAPTVKQMLIVGLWFGGFQALMPVIGYFLGASFYDLISDYDHWIAFGLLTFIGVNMIREALSEEEDVDDDTGYRTMVVLAVATSIDALVVGVTMAMDGWDITSSAIMIGVVTFLLAAMGVKLGAVFGDKFGSKSGILGGVILILIGLRILLEHTGVI